MRTRNLALGLGILVAAALGCKFGASTANISSVKLGKDKTASQETGSFAPTDTVYAVAQISNASEKLKAGRSPDAERGRRAEGSEVGELHRLLSRAPAAGDAVAARSDETLLSSDS
ncbi:MAG: hypothetical protein LC746_05670 [Acidobacteria bacterium]|nr:hypothetical protein [Acidobacteriota bacterium]